MSLRTLSLIAVAIVTAAPLVNAARPNILFILADDWGQGDVKTYGGDRCKIDTPNMDQLAVKGMKFMDAHSSSAVCSPTRYGVLTGRYNWRSRLKKGVLNGVSPALIEPGRMTVASLLKKNGYTTAMFGKWHLGMGFPTTDGNPAKCSAKKVEELTTKCNIDWKGTIKNGPTSVGFDSLWGFSASLDMPPYIWIENDHFVGECTTIKAFHRPGPAHADFEDYDVLPTLAKKASEFVTAQARTPEPFFLYMPLNSPHTPIAPSKAFQGKSKMGSYGDFVMETDWAIGQVVQAVEAAGIADNTLIIVTADNGCSPQALRSGSNKTVTFRTGGNEPEDPAAHYSSNIYRGHKADIYEGGHRIPYIARWDGNVKPSSICNDTICLVDLYATCAEIIGAPVEANAAEDSVSLLPLLLDTAKSPVREAIVHHSINGSFAIRQGNWKLSFCPGSGGWSAPKPKLFEKTNDVQDWVQLFDLSSDPSETTNLAAKHPETVERLTLLAQQTIDNGRSTPGPKQENNDETHLYPEWIRKARP